MASTAIPASAAAAASVTRVWLGRGIRVLVVIVVAVVLARLGSRLTTRVLRSVRLRAARLPASPRTGLRIDTLAHLVSSVWRAVVWVTAVFAILGTLGIDLVPFVAGATVIGAAIGFGAQSLIKDLLGGFFIFVEDQYGVGDTITLGDTTGIVEELNLRVTRLRAVDGRVWWVPNGEVRRVANASIQWSRAIVDLAVPAGADVERCLITVEEEAAHFAADPAWSKLCLDAPEVLGLQAMDVTALTLRVAVRTPVLEAERVARGLRAQVTARLSHEGMLGPGG